MKNGKELNVMMKRRRSKYFWCSTRGHPKKDYEEWKKLEQSKEENEMQAEDAKYSTAVEVEEVEVNVMSEKDVECVEAEVSKHETAVEEKVQKAMRQKIKKK